jgi:hypothetical protein
MSYDQDVFINQFPLVKLFIYHLIYSRVVRDSYVESQLQNEFWSLTIDAHLLRATINWCMVFGSDSNSTHWKRLVKPSKKNLAQSFRDGLFETTGLDKEHWHQYWKSMTEFRNKYAAHRELEKFSDPVPDFDTALTVAYHYDRWVRKIISPDKCEEPPLERFATSLKQAVTPLVNKLLIVTKAPI